RIMWRRNGTMPSLSGRNSPTGSQPSFTPNEKTSSRPSQKAGIERPASAKAIATWSSHVFARTAASRPRGMASARANSSAATASETVGGEPLPDRGGHRAAEEYRLPEVGPREPAEVADELHV